MSNLLINSLMADCNLENALQSTIALETQDKTAGNSDSKPEQPFPLLQLVQQLVSNSTKRQIAYFKLVSTDASHCRQYTHYHTFCS